VFETIISILILREPPLLISLAIAGGRSPGVVRNSTALSSEFV